MFFVHLLSVSHVVKALFAPRIAVPPLCRGLGGVEGGSQRFLERSGIVRKTFTGGMAAIRRFSHCISIKLQVVRLTEVTDSSVCRLSESLSVWHILTKGHFLCTRSIRSHQSLICIYSLGHCRAERLHFFSSSTY